MVKLTQLMERLNATVGVQTVSYNQPKFKLKKITSMVMYALRNWKGR